MNPLNMNNQDMPGSYNEAVSRLRQEYGQNILYKQMQFVLKGVRALVIAPRYRSQRIENPARKQSLWGWLTADEYVWTSVRDLGELYVDGRSAGRLHGHSEDHANAIAPLLATAPQNLIVSGHHTESGWYIDSIAIAP